METSLSGELTIELGRFARGEDLPVDPARIDAELDRLWREIAHRVCAGRPGTPSVYRACLFNLVAYAPDPYSEVVARFLTSALTDRLPARVVLVRAAGEGDAAPRAWIASQSDPERASGTRVSGELIVLAASGAGLARVPPLVRSVLEPDLPTTLWWVGAPPGAGPLVDALCGLADRVVVDSESFDTCASDVTHALTCRGGTAPADLTWPRLRPWRQAVARAFDDPAARPFLEGVNEVEVGVGGAGASTGCGAALLAGWLAAALDWSAPSCSGPDAVALRGPRGPVRLTFVPGAGPRRLERVTLRGADGATVAFERVGSSPGCVEARVPASFPAVRPAPFREPSAEDVLAAAVLAIGADPIAGDALRRAAEIAATLGSGTATPVTGAGTGA